jgi:hypothetical protein
MKPIKLDKRPIWNQIWHFMQKDNRMTNVANRYIFKGPMRKPTNSLMDKNTN